MVEIYMGLCCLLYHHFVAQDLSFGRFLDNHAKAFQETENRRLCPFDTYHGAWDYLRLDVAFSMSAVS